MRRPETQKYSIYEGMVPNRQAMTQTKTIEVSMPASATDSSN